MTEKSEPVPLKRAIPPDLQIEVEDIKTKVPRTTGIILSNRFWCLKKYFSITLYIRMMQGTHALAVYLKCMSLIVPLVPFVPLLLLRNQHINIWSARITQNKQNMFCLTAAVSTMY